MQPLSFIFEIIKILTYVLKVLGNNKDIIFLIKDISHSYSVSLIIHLSNTRNNTQGIGYVTMFCR